jgi:hypothetical protein
MCWPGLTWCAREAYRHMVGPGFRTEISGVTNHGPNEAGRGPTFSTIGAKEPLIYCRLLLGS